MKRDATDAIFSDLIREAYDWTCANCDRPFPDRKGKDVQCSHIYKRKHHSTRWFPDGAICLCATCHAYYEDRPPEHAEFARKILGDVRFEWLRQRFRGIYRYRPADKKAMREHYRAELERIRALRAEGVTGYVEVAAYD